MMTTRYLTTPGSAPASGGTAPCGCGQHPCGCGQGTPPSCCDCECDTGCLSRPHFYCGMVLTDDQLNDLAQWVRRRSALHRYVEGWGVVRGLGIRCDPAGPGCVVVGPGYARSCCGDDIVLCQDTCLDVCGCQPAGPCCDQDAGQDGLRAVDLYLRYAETQQDPAKVMASCGCGGHDSVEYERVAETGTLCCVPVADTGTDPATLAARDWERGYAACAAVVRDYLLEVSDRASAEDRLKWILRWIDRAADDALCCLRQRLCRTGFGADGAAGTLLEIVSALRNRYLEATYGQCRPSQGVLLARVWLGRDENGRCVVDCIDSHPPFRRVITAPGWPDLPGHINAAGLWWQRRAIACDRIRQLGLKVIWRQYRRPDSVAELAEFLDGDSAFVPCDAEYEAWLYRDRCGHWDGDEPDGRVVWLRPAAAQVGTPPPVPRATAPRTPAPRAARGRSAARKDNQ
jgi:hypothetical protein